MYKKIILIFFIFFYSCSNKNFIYEKIGFAGISKENNIISHLPKNSVIKITNKNNKVSKIYKTNEKLLKSNSRIIYLPNYIHKDIGLDENLPLVHVQSIRENKTFIAKKTKTYEEEKNVNKKIKLEYIEIAEIKKEKSDNKKIYLEFGPFYYKTYADTFFKLLNINIKNNKLVYKNYRPKKYAISIGPLNNLNQYDNMYSKLERIGLIGFNIKIL